MFKLIKNKSFKNLIIFDLIYQISIIILLTPFGKEFFSIIYKFTKEGFFSIESINSFILSPIKIITILVLLLIFSFIKLFEISGFIFTINQIRIKNTVSTIEILNNAYKYIKIKIKNFQNFLIILPLLVSIPITSFSHKKFILPSFIYEYIISLKFVPLLFFIFTIIKFILCIKLIFLFHIFFLENKTFFESIVSSFKIIRKKFFKSFKVMTIIFIKSIIIECVKIAVLFLIIFIFYNQNEKKNLSNIIIIIYFCIGTTIKIFANILSNFIIFNGISKFYFKFNKENINNKVYKNNKIKLKISLSLIFLILIASFNKYKNSVKEINFLHNLQNLKPTITAHRGSTKNVPENTMQSINEAISLKADFAEIDVHLTKDNIVVLSHDNNIKRLTGQKGRINNLTFKELKEKKIIYKNKKYDFIDLKTVLENVENKIKLNIELKPVNGNEKILAKKVLEIIGNRNDKVIISSLSIKALKEVKNINYNISTGLILAVAYGDFYKIPFVDFFCIEEQFASTENIQKIKKNNKLIYVWTTNDKQNIKDFCQKGINGIITDEVETSKKIIDNIDLNFNKLIFEKILTLIN